MMLSSVVSGNSGTVSDLDRSTRYALVVQRLSSPDKALVCGISYRRVDQMRYADLKSIFILTKAEDKILRQLLQGMVADHIAEENATSLDTVRSHIRSIYSKLGVSSREALFNRVSLYRIP
ncbi:MAG: helix-turn-helix transcriptional regulator [Sphingobium limneticum]